MSKFAIIISLLILTLFVFFLSPASAILPADGNGDGKVDGVDYVIWSRNYNKTTNNGQFSGDFDGSGFVDGVDYVIWFKAYGSTEPINATSTPVIVPSPTSSPVTPPPAQGNGIWISPEEIKNLPISGQPGCTQGTLCYDAWNAIISKADSNWSAPNLSDYAGLGHSQAVWAGALSAKRLSFESNRQSDAQKYYNKTIQALNDVIGTEVPALPSSGGGKDDGSLAIARQFPRYVLAADLLGITDWGPNYKGYKNFVDYMLHTKFTFRVGDGGHTFSEGHDTGASNGSTMAGASRIASAAYLKDTAELDWAFIAFRRYTGDRNVGQERNFNSGAQSWIHDLNLPMAINPKGATCHGTSYPADGVIPNDQGRGGSCPSNPNQAPGYTQYPWEGLQGVYAQAMMLYRLGYKDSQGNNPWKVNDSALLRAVQYQWYLQQKFGGSWYDSSRAAWVKHLANVFYGFKPIQYNATDGGRNLSLTQWTVQK